ncbi:MAG: class I SAM-dependent methyltransferase [Patescibacteria group bacterium]
MTNHKYDYGQKYQTGGIGGFLIDNFYHDLAALSLSIKFNNCLEVGSGEGYSTQRIASFLPSHVNFEASEYEAELITKIKSRNPRLHVMQENIYQMKRMNKAFDLIYCLEVLEHLVDPITALQELHRVSRQYVIASVPHEPWWRLLNLCRLHYVKDWGNTPGHIQHWDVGSFKQLVSDRFNIIQVKKPLPWIIFLLEKK